MTNHENLLKYENNGLSNRLRDVSHCATRRVYKLIKIDSLSSSARQRIILPGSNVVCVHHVIQYYEKFIQQAWHRGTRLVFHAQGIGRRLRGDFDSNYKCALLGSQVKPPISQLKLQIPKYDSSDYIRQVGPIILIQASSPIGGDNVI